MKVNFYRCNHCGKIILIINDKPTSTICCNSPMELLIPGTVDASIEKHIPHPVQKGNKLCVKVGSEEHPMKKEHYIQWIALITNNGVSIKYLEPENPPIACFLLQDNEQAVEVYEYCSVHSLWKLDLKQKPL